jgi:hypothetical protein
MTLRASLFAALLLAALPAPGMQHAAFISGVWQGDANFDADDKFSDCTMTAQAESGILIGFVISRDYDWGLVLADETRAFKVGSSEPVALMVDERDPIPAIAKVIDVHGNSSRSKIPEPCSRHCAKARCLPSSARTPSSASS